MDLRQLVSLRLLRRREQKFKADIESEFCHHIDSLIEQNKADGMDPDTARRDAYRRFGPLDDLKKECLKIRQQGPPGLRPVRWFLSLVFVTGIWIRVAGSDIYELQIGNMLVAISAAAGVLLYVHSWGRSTRLPPQVDKHPLGLAATFGRGAPD